MTTIYSSDSPKADMLYGESGTGKTTQLGRMARFVYKKTGKITRLISADAGGWKAVENYVQLGIIQPFSLLDDKVIAPLSCISKLMCGYWPFDPETGAPLLRTITGTKTDLDGKSVYDFTNPKAKPTAATWEKVGGMGVEGLHSITVFIQDYLSANPSILGELAGGVGTKGGSASQIKEGSEVYVQPGKASYGYVQKKSFDLVRQSCDLPLEKMVWTSLAKQYQETDKDGVVIASEHYYPSNLGKAGLKATPQWFGMLMHLESIQIGIDKEDRPDKVKRLAAELIGTTKTEIRAYLKDHANAKDGYICKAKPRVAFEVAHKMPTSFKVTLEAERAGEVHDLCSLYELEDSLQQSATDLLAKDLGIVGRSA